MVLHHRILFSTAITEAILMKTSVEQVPSLHRVAPRYLKWVTSSSFWLFMVISALIFLLLVMILLFSVLTSIFRFSAYESVGNVLKFIIAATHR